MRRSLQRSSRRRTLPQSLAPLGVPSGCDLRPNSRTARFYSRHEPVTVCKGQVETERVGRRRAIVNNCFGGRSGAGARNDDEIADDKLAVQLSRSRG